MKGVIILLVAVVLVAHGKSTDKASQESAKATKRDKTDLLADAEQSAGQAVLKLLDAKIGSKVQDAAKEVTDFLTSAIGKHASSRTNKIRQDKQKEMSLLHLGAINTIKTDVKKHEDKPQLKKKKDGSFLVHFKIPYIVTPIKKKKHHHHHHKYHHKHHSYHHKHKAAAKHDKPPPIEVPSAPYHPATTHPGTLAPSPYTHSTGGYTNGYTNGYTSGATHAATMAPVSTAPSGPSGPFRPCEGMCTAPCTPQCTPATDCCCCPDPNTAVPPAAVPLPPLPPLPPMMPPPMFPNPNQPPLSPSQFMQLPLLPGSSCPQICQRHCIPRCPSDCCDDDKKRRNHVEKPAKTEDKPKQEVAPVNKETEDKPVGDKKTETKQAKKQEDQETIEDQRDEGSSNEAIDDDVE